MNEDLLRKLEGLHTIETIMEELDLTRGSTLNLLSKLKKEGFMTLWKGGKKRIYKITIKKQRKRDIGMFDMINKYNKNFKLNPWYDHQVHGHYRAEEAIVDAVQTKNFRVILGCLRLFNHVTDWSKLYKLSKEKDIWQQVGALYDVAKKFMKVRRMKEKPNQFKTWKHLTKLGNRNNFPEIQNKWKTYIPFNINDLRQVI